MKKIILLTLIVFSSCTMKKQDISVLFDPPTELEKEQVIKDWNSRDVGVYNWKVLTSKEYMGYRVDVVSHSVDSLIHYGLIRQPKIYNTDSTYPILIVNHGGVNGCDLNILNSYSKDLYNNYFIIAASFIGEPLDTKGIGLGVLQSEGKKSIFNKDIDDVLALLNGTIKNYAGADTNNIMTIGESRGACVSYLASIRDSRIKKAVIFYGVTDHMTYPNLEEIVDSRKKDNPLPWIVRITALDDYRKGKITLKEARHNLLMRSPIQFIQRFPKNIQIHHGVKDYVVKVENSRLIDSLLRGNSAFEHYHYYEYPNGGHGNNMPHSIERRDSFICN